MQRLNYESILLWLKSEGKCRFAASNLRKRLVGREPLPPSMKSSDRPPRHLDVQHRAEEPELDYGARKR